MTLKTTCMFCALVALLATPGFCTVITYTDLASWQNATTGDSTINFNGITAVGTQVDFSNNNTSMGLVIGGVDFEAMTSANTFDEHVLNPTAGQQYYDYGTGSILYWNPYTSGTYPYLAVTLPQAVTAVGLDIMTGGPGNIFYAGLGNLTFAYSSAPTTGWSTPNFFGLTSDTPFTTFYLQMPGGNTPIIGPLSYGSEQTQGGGGGGGGDPTDTPEVATFLMIATGLIALGKGRRVLHRAVAA